MLIGLQGGLQPHLNPQVAPWGPGFLTVIALNCTGFISCVSTTVCLLEPDTTAVAVFSHVMENEASHSGLQLHKVWKLFSRMHLLPPDAFICPEPTGIVGLRVAPETYLGKVVLQN